MISIFSIAKEEKIIAKYIGYFRLIELFYNMYS